MLLDLNLEVSAKSAQERREVLATVLSLGYSGAAVSVAVTAPFAPRQIPSLKPVDPGSILSASASASAASSNLQSLLSTDATPFQQLSRLTVLGSPEDDAAEAVLASIKTAQRSGALAPFHIVAAQPTTQKALAKLCSSDLIDVVCIDIRIKLPFKLRFQMVSTAVKRGIFFEIAYAPFLDPGTLRQAIMNAQMIQEVTRGKNLILSSGGCMPAHIRSPRDAASLAHLFNMTPAQAHQALAINPLRCLAEGKKRRLLFKGTIWMDKIVLRHADASLEAQQRSLLTATRSGSKGNEEHVQEDNLAVRTLASALEFGDLDEGKDSFQYESPLDFMSLDFGAGWQTVSKKKNPKKENPAKRKR